MAVGNFKLPISGATTPTDEWVRPTDWLAMPTIGTQEFIGLLAITDDESNHIALLCAGNYTVNWGDGVIENVATGVKAEHTYTYSAISAGTLSTRGYKQVIVRVTPQGGQNLTTVNLQQQNSIINKTHATGWLDININGSNITTLTLGGNVSVRNSMCERVIVSSIGSITNFTNLFAYFNSLQSVSIDTSTGINFGSMFYECNSLKTIPLLNTSNATNMSSMFSNCYSLKSIPLLDTSKVITINSWLVFCYSLETIPAINTVSVTNMSSMFYYCYSLKSIPLLNTSLVTNFSSMFNACTSLKSIPLLDTSNGINFEGMFIDCYVINNIPLLNTSKNTNFGYMFQNCKSLQSIPVLDVALGTVFTNMFYLSPSIAKARLEGTKFTILCNNMCLSQNAIVDIFNGLETVVVARTINVSGNPGRAALTAGEIAIATSKGWTVV